MIRAAGGGGTTGGGAIADGGGALSLLVIINKKVSGKMAKLKDLNHLQTGNSLIVLSKGE